MSTAMRLEERQKSMLTTNNGKNNVFRDVHGAKKVISKKGHLYYIVILMTAHHLF